MDDLSLPYKSLVTLVLVLLTVLSVSATLRVMLNSFKG